ncbi:MAG: AAA family ATPase [Candidatus Thermoplasmatota archaeon]|nr:AAA family ATPase [Candidatus Thermoplasmatota archaeon]MCL5730584.1 AAA family ATPase [Candidatus Thermoplasmatota archaeon]
MIAISGVPASGKTYLCERLVRSGFRCISLSDLPEFRAVAHDGTVDPEDLAGIVPETEFIESHLSHLMNVDAVLILEADENTLVLRMKSRGYSDAKIQENVDAQRCGAIYYEALERLPANRIRVIRSDIHSTDPLKEAVELLERFGHEDR